MMGVGKPVTPNILNPKTPRTDLDNLHYYQHTLIQLKEITINS